MQTIELMFRMEHEADLLWINSDSAYNIHEQWLQTHFKNNQRAQILIVKNKNILTKESILEVRFYRLCALCTQILEIILDNSCNLILTFADVRDSQENTIY